MNIEILKSFMHEYGLSVAALAEHLGLTRVRLSNKLNPRQADKLTEEEIAAIKRFLMRLHKDTRELLANGLEELPASLKE